MNKVFSEIKNLLSLAKFTILVLYYKITEYITKIPNPELVGANALILQHKMKNYKNITDRPVDSEIKKCFYTSCTYYQIYKKTIDFKLDGTEIAQIMSRFDNRSPKEILDCIKGISGHIRRIKNEIGE